MRFAKTIIGLGLFVSLACLAQVPYHNSPVWRAQQWKSPFQSYYPANPLIWIDAYSNLTNTSGNQAANGEQIAVWGNKIANGLNFTNYYNNVSNAMYSSSGGPINGPRILFYQVGGYASHFQILSATDYPQPNTVVMVATVPGNAAGNNFSMSRDLSHRHDVSFAQSGHGAFSLYAGTDSCYGVTNQIPRGTGEYFIIVGQFNGASSFIRIDGTNYASGNAGNQSNVGFYLGTYWGDPALYHSEYIVEWMFYNRLLTLAEVMAVEKALSNKHGIPVPF